jgi:Fic family protein
MRMPTPPPSLSEAIPESDPGWFIRLGDPAVAEFVRRANDSYVSWHKVQHYKNLPDGFTPKQGWGAIVVSRIQQHQPIAIQFDSSRLVYWNPPAHLECLHKIDQQGGGAIGSNSIHIPSGDNERYLLNALMEEAIASSQLEGAVTTRKVAKRMLREGRRPRSKAEKMIVNNYLAIQRIRDCQNDALCPELLKEWHAILTSGTLDDPTNEGQFRTPHDQVVVEDSYTHEVLHTPPAADSLNGRIEEICTFANEKSKPFIHPVIKAIILHFAIGYVHPFADGNGRTARALFYWYMLRHGYWLFEFLPLSRLFLQAPAKYARAYLHTEIDRGDVTYFIHYNLTVILRAMKEFHLYLSAQQQRISEAARLLDRTPGLNHRQQSLIYHALKNSDAMYTIQEYKGTYGVSYGTAHSDLLRLAEVKYLQMTRQGNKIVFYPHGELLLRLKQTSRAISKSSLGGRTIPQPLAVTRVLTKEMLTDDANEPQSRLF